MISKNMWGLRVHPKREWEAVRGNECTTGRRYANHGLILAAIPVISGLIGAARLWPRCWQVAARLWSIDLEARFAG
jgi:hypothetical protein